MTEVCNLLEKIIDPMVIIITVVGLIAGCFFMRIYRFLYFFKCPPMILGGFMYEPKDNRSRWLLQLEMLD